MVLRTLASPMTRWASLPLALVLALLAPAALADFVNSGTSNGDQDDVAQFHCELVQTEPRTRVDPTRCDLTGQLVQANVMRMRVVGPGRLYGFLINEWTNTQIAQLECVSTLQASCVKFLPGGMGGTTASRVGFHALLDGPSPAVATVEVVRATISLP